MKNLKSKKVLLGVTGSIAVYKSLLLVRLLIKSGAEVKVVMTKAATEFVSALSFSTLSKNPVLVDLSQDGAWANHVEWGLWADAFVIAPATANTLAKMANGIADNMLLACYLSAKCPVFVCPAMDLDMWKHPSTKANLDKLESYQNKIIPVESGELASGLYGEGRMAEPENILSFLDRYIGGKQDLKGKTIIVSAGPTYEDIDPVRYIGNNSSGKMGIALAENCFDRGAKVHLVLGPTHQHTYLPEEMITRVRSANQMFEAIDNVHSQSDALIMAAAIADYTPLRKCEQKIKKTGGDIAIQLQRTIDISKTLSKSKMPNQVHVGFALETNDEEMNAKKKLVSKNFDFIVLNSLNDKGAGFGHDTNKVSLHFPSGKQINIELMTKKKLAVKIIDQLVIELEK